MTMYYYHWLIKADILLVARPKKNRWNDQTEDTESKMGRVGELRAALEKTNVPY